MNRTPLWLVSAPSVGVDSGESEKCWNVVSRKTFGLKTDVSLRSRFCPPSFALYPDSSAVRESRPWLSYSCGSQVAVNCSLWFVDISQVTLPKTRFSLVDATKA